MRNPTTPALNAASIPDRETMRGRKRQLLSKERISGVSRSMIFVVLDL